MKKKGIIPIKVLINFYFFFYEAVKFHILTFVGMNSIYNFNTFHLTENKIGFIIAFHLTEFLLCKRKS